MLGPSNVAGTTPKPTPQPAHTCIHTLLGLGLFADKNIIEGEVVAIYSGKLTTTIEKSNKSNYVLEGKMWMPKKGMFGIRVTCGGWAEMTHH